MRRFKAGKMVQGVVACFDEDWIDPGETEYAAWCALRTHVPPQDILYVALPWSWMAEAARAGRAEEMERRLGDFVARLPSARHVLTLCAHPDLELVWPFLRRAGVTELFWPWLSTPPAAFQKRLILHPVAQHAPAPIVPPGSAGFADCTAPEAMPQFWAALAAGQIPVFRSDKLALPGAAALWLAGGVPTDATTTPAGLTDWLVRLAADPARLAEKQAALSQIVIEHQGTGLVAPIYRRMLALAAADAAEQQLSRSVAAMPRLLQLAATLRTDLAFDLPLQVGAARQVLLAAASLLLKASEQGASWLQRGIFPRLIMAAEAALPETDAVLAHYRLTAAAPAQSLAAPHVLPELSLLPGICLFGYHSNRTPLSYAPLRVLLQGRLRFCDTPERADLVVAGFNIDFARNLDWVQSWRARRPDLRFAVLSEEPLWDTTWSEGWTEPRRRMQTPTGEFEYDVLNHVTSDIFACTDLPYFLLTDDIRLARLAGRMARFAAETPNAVLARWQTLPFQAAFIAERRDGSEFCDPGLGPNEGPQLRLSGWRSALTAAVTAPALRLGRGWHSDHPRQVLTDWHLDKLAAIEGQTRLLGAIENTHLRDYVTEKPFDAFAAGALPVVVAGPGHRLCDWIAPQAMLNLWGLTATAAARTVDAFLPDLAAAEAWSQSCGMLAARLSNGALVQREREALITRSCAALSALL